MFDRRLLQNFDWPLLIVVYLIALAGLFTIYSAVEPGARGAGQIFSVKQVIWFGVGTLAMIAAFSFPYQWLDRYVWLVYAACLALLAWVLVFGKVVSGSRRWIAMGPFTLQPSELAKLAVIVVMAHILSRTLDEKGLSFKDLLRPLVFLVPPFTLVVLEPDLGTSMLLLLIAAVMAFYVGVRRRTLLVLAVIALAAGPAVWMGLKGYQKERILTFINPDRDPLRAGYHIIQSKIAIGSGMVTGKGFLEGSQKALSFLPEQHTDFIFPVLAEEWGLAGSSVLLAAFLLLMLLCLNVAYKSKDPFGSLLAVGVSAMIFWQVFINMGMVMGLFPVVGVPLPLMSYGGSSVLTTMIGIGLLQNISMRRYLFE
ncbi:MAG: rod shape-determining protein RodA [Thermodesulfobacteriota bacterium]